MVATASVTLLLLAGCGSPDTAGGATAARDTGERIACAHGVAALAKDCVVERTTSTNGLVLTLRHPDGAFRRLLVTRDGRGVIAADGSQPAKVTIAGEGIAVTIGGDHYLLPATIKGGAATQ